MSTEECDIVVVGLGAMGSATFDQLAIRGVDVIGIDRFVPPHDRGSSHGSSRITREALGEGPVFVQFVRASHKRWKELEQETGEKLFEQCGAVMIDYAHKSSSHKDDDFIQTTFDTAIKYGIPHEKLDRDGVVSKYPQFAGMDKDDIAYYEPGAGYVRPEKCIETQIKDGQSHGGKIFTGEIVTNIQSTEPGVTVSTSSGLVVKAKKAIVAAGAWISGLLGEKYKNLFEVSRQVQFWIALEEGYQFPPSSPVYIWVDGQGEAGSFYGFPPLPGENTIKAGSEQRDSTTDPDDVDRNVTEEEAKEMISTHLKGRMMGISDRAVKSYACLLTFTPDHSFILDYHPELPNVFVVAACSGHGFKHSAGVGQAVAKKVTGEDSEFDLSPFSFARFN